MKKGHKESFCMMKMSHINFLKDCIYLFFLKREKEEEMERNIKVRNTDCLPLTPNPAKDRTCNPGMCPD